jgi:DNA-binding transcriptional MerR regulator
MPPRAPNRIAATERPAAVELPPIPAKRYFTIGEVSELCAVKQHVLRYWEQEFTQLKPLKRSGNRRYYQHHEVLLIRRIRELLYEQGFTIHGARNRLIGGAAAPPAPVGAAIPEPREGALAAPEATLGGATGSAAIAQGGTVPTGTATGMVAARDAAAGATSNANAQALRSELLALRRLLLGEG